MKREITGNIVDIPAKNIFYGTITINNKQILSIVKISEDVNEHSPFITPGFVDAHVHVESSMLVPSEFARLAVVHGTVGTISDPHEIANVCGLEGVNFMIENGSKVPFKFNFGAPSCVPATTFETAGDALDAADVDALLARPEILYLSEMMNFPGVLFNDEEVMKKIASAKKYNKPVDGHAPGLRGTDAKKYIDAGISTDHECFTADEALDKLGYGMKILIREGSAAKNFEALIGLVDVHFENMMFCSDDKHPDSLAENHINKLCSRAVEKGIDIFKILQVACINPVKHYNMDIGLLKEGDHADLIVLKDLTNFEVLETYINGELVAKDGKTFIKKVNCNIINKFDCKEIVPEELVVKANIDNPSIYVIGALDGQLITDKISYQPNIENGNIVTSLKDDVLKIVVINRYFTAKPAMAFIKNFGLKKGAIASSVAHDSHNIVAIGVDDESMAKAINLVIKERGGIAAVGNEMKVLSLPVAGLMSEKDGYEIAAAYTDIDQYVKRDLGSTLGSPFMTLSFMALLVIPHLKLSDKGLFDGDSFSFISN